MIPYPLFASFHCLFFSIGQNLEKGQNGVADQPVSETPIGSAVQSTEKNEAFSVTGLFHQEGFN